MVILVALMICGLAYGDADTIPASFQSTQHVLNRVWDSTSNELNMTDTNSSFDGFRKTITFGEVPIVLSSDTPISWISLRATTGNTGDIMIAGRASLSQDDGYILDASEIVDFNIDNLADIFVFARFSGDSVDVLYTVK
jgi:hypothetical protein